jgi:hypothetical protein
MVYPVGKILGSIIARSAAFAHLCTVLAGYLRISCRLHLFIRIYGERKTPRSAGLPILDEYDPTWTLSFPNTRPCIFVQTLKASEYVGLFCKRIETAQEENLLCIQE